LLLKAAWGESVGDAIFLVKNFAGRNNRYKPLIAFGFDYSIVRNMNPKVIFRTGDDGGAGQIAPSIARRRRDMGETIRRPRGRPRTANPEQGGVRSLERALTLLSTLARRDTATLAELAGETGMPPSSAHRLLGTLQASRYVDFDEATARWRVGVEAFRAGASFTRRATVTDAARGELRALMERTGETANLALPDGGEVVFVGQVETSQPIRAFFGPGARARMHASGIGKAILSALPEEEAARRLGREALPRYTPRTLTDRAALSADLAAAAARGWALDDEERNLGMRCVAAAIRDAHGAVVAGLSISGPTARLTPGVVEEAGPVVRAAAARVTEALGGEVG
jgi:IclR family acetate operon transcriptional repressor